MSILSTGTAGSLNSTVGVTSLDNAGSLSFLLTGTWVGTLTFQGSLDGSSFIDMLAISIGTGFPTSTTTINGSFFLNGFGLKAAQIKMTSYTSGTANITIQSANGSALQNTLSYLVGVTDGSRIGNNGDRLKVDASVTGLTGGVLSTYSSKLRIEPQTSPITLSVGVYTNVYTYTGSGNLIGFNLEFNNTNIVVRIVIDGETIMDGTSLATLNSLLATANNSARYQAGQGVVTNSSAIDISFRQPIKFTSNITISANPNSGLLPRTFNQGIVYIMKET